MVSLYDFQKVCVDKLGDPGLASRLVGDEMGLGKTLEAVAIDASLRFGMNNNKSDPYVPGKVWPTRFKTLIVAPLSVHDHWRKHVLMLQPRARIFVIDRKDRPGFIKALGQGYDVYICHYEALRLKDTQPAIRAVAWFHVIADECVPLGTEILTAEGWKTYDQLKIGEKVFGYEDDQLFLTELLAINLPGKRRVGTLQTKGFSAVTTPNHDWLMRNKFSGEVQKVEAAEPKVRGDHQEIVLAAPYNGGSLPVTPDEASFIAWILGDGGIYAMKGTTSYSAFIYQTKPRCVRLIDDLLSTLKVEHTKKLLNPNEEPGGFGSTKPRYQWRVSIQYVRELFTRSGLDWRDKEKDLIQFVLGLSSYAREAFCATTNLAEGSNKSQAYVRKDGTLSPIQVDIVQNPGPIQDAYRLAFFLEGTYPSSRSGRDRFGVTRPRKRADSFKWNDIEGELEVWCPTTGTGNWVMRQGSMIAITGNCHRIKNRKAQQTRAIKELRTRFKTGLSGTPADNKPQDLWSVLHWLWPKKYTSYWRYVALYCTQKTYDRQTGRELSPAELALGAGGSYGTTFRKIVGVNEATIPVLLREMGPFYVRRLKADVLTELPAKYYCTPAETPIMMGDLIFKPISEVRPGDVVMGWDESAGVGKKRQLRPARVVSTGRLRRPLVKATLESGRSVRCTPDHLWRNGIGSSPATWVQLGQSSDDRKNKQSKAILRVVDEVPRELSPEEHDAALWLGGILDGEGSFTHNSVGDHWSVHQSRAKNPEVWSKIKATLDALGIDYKHDQQGTWGPEDNFRFPTTRGVALKILTWCKPVKHRQVLLNLLLNRGFTSDKMVTLEYEQGESEVFWLETETGNYVAWGYASKNSDIVVELPPRQRRAYDQMRRDMLAWVGEHEDQALSAPVVIAQLVRLQQFALASPDISWKYVMTRRARELAAKNGTKPEPERRMVVVLEEPSAKLDALEEIIEDAEGEPIVVFSQSRSMVNLVAARLASKKIEVGRYTGTVPQAERDLYVERFQQGDLRVLAGTIAAGGESITLHRASTVVFLDRHWSPAKNVQAEDRLHRVGQKDAVQVIDIIARDTVDLGRRAVIASKWATLKLLLGDTVDAEKYTDTVAYD